MNPDLIIVQARTLSSRLPGKVLRPLWKNKSLLDIQLLALEKLDISFVVATTTHQADDEIVRWANHNHVNVFRGDEQNVLKRFINCAQQYGAKNLIRVCSDNPFIQLDQVPYFLQSLEQGLDYISYCNNSGIPAIKTHWGLFVEGVRLSSLEKASELLETHPEKKFYSEHVTNFIYGNPEQFNVKLNEAPKSIASRNDLRFTIDTEEDSNNMMELLEILDGNQKSLDELISITDNNPHILSMMEKGILTFKK